MHRGVLAQRISEPDAGKWNPRPHPARAATTGPGDVAQCCCRRSHGMNAEVGKDRPQAPDIGELDQLYGFLRVVNGT